MLPHAYSPSHVTPSLMSLPCHSLSLSHTQVFELLRDPALTQQLAHNTQYFRHGMLEAGFSIKEGTHPIVVSLPCSCVKYGFAAFA